jgi:hypothetical protein
VRYPFADEIDHRVELWPAIGDARQLLFEHLLASGRLKPADLSLKAGNLIDGAGPRVTDLHRPTPSATSLHIIWQ